MNDGRRGSALKDQANPLRSVEIQAEKKLALRK